MNIPVGKVVEKRVSFADSAPYERAAQLLEKGFEGYMAATIEGVTGIEEALLLIKGKELVGAIFEAVRFKKVFYGVDGLQLALNLLRAEKGVFDVNSLSRQQIELIIAFNENVGLAKPVGKGTLLKLLPSSYHKEAVLEYVKASSGKSETRESILKRFGLGSI